MTATSDTLSHFIANRFTDASSSGSREQGPAAPEFYTELKTVEINP